MNLDKKTIKENFNEDIDNIKSGRSTTTYYIEKQGKLKPRNESTPNNLNTSERVMELATGHGNKVYQNPLQLAIAVKGFEDWCIDRNVAPSYAGLAYYLNISKDTLIKYTRDTTQYICYSIVDNVTDEYIYSTNDKSKLDKYISSYYLVEDIDNNNNVVYSDIKYIRDIKDNINDYSKVISVRDKIDNKEYSINECVTTFAKILAPINNLLEMVNINKAEVARNPAWHIFLAKNNFGRTTQYVDQVQQQISVHNPLDEMSDEEILKAAQSRPQE